MRARSIPFGSMFAWIPATFRLVGNNAGAMVAASLIMLLAGVVLMAPVFYFMFKSMLTGLGAPGVPQPQDMTAFWIAYAICIVAGLLLFPPMLAGWFRLCAGADSGHGVAATQILSVYGDGATWVRLIAFAFVAMLSYALVFGLMYLVFHGAFDELLAMQAAQQAALATGAPPPPPSMALLGQIFALYAVMLPTMFVLQFIYMVGFAEVSLRSTSPLAAFGEAAGGVLRNLVKLLVLMFCVGIVAMFALFLVGLLVALLAVAVSFISKALMFVVMALFYAAFLLLIYPLMFSFHYYVWKDMLGSEEAPAGNAVAA